MAVTAPLTVRQQVFAGKLETTNGTAIALTASDATWNIFNPSIKPVIPPTERQGQGSYSPLKAKPGARAAEITFRTEVHGLGSSGVPAWGDLLKCAGFGLTSQTYTVTSGSSSGATMTVGHYRDGSRFLSAVGCMFDMKMSGRRGEPVYCDWTGKGKWVAPSTVSIITPTYTTVSPPVLLSATLTLGGSAYVLSGFDLELGNDVMLREDITDATGYLSAYIVNRAIKFMVSVEASALGTKDWYADHLAETTAALNLVIGSGSNLVTTITAPALQLLNPPEAEDDQGVLKDKLEFISPRSAAAGDDELVIAFT